MDSSRSDHTLRSGGQAEYSLCEFKRGQFLLRVYSGEEPVMMWKVMNIKPFCSIILQNSWHMHETFRLHSW